MPIVRVVPAGSAIWVRNDSKVEVPEPFVARVERYLANDGRHELYIGVVTGPEHPYIGMEIVLSTRDGDGVASHNAKLHFGRTSSTNSTDIPDGIALVVVGIANVFPI